MNATKYTKSDLENKTIPINSLALKDFASLMADPEITANHTKKSHFELLFDCLRLLKKEDQGDPNLISMFLNLTPPLIKLHQFGIIAKKPIQRGYTLSKKGLTELLKIENKKLLIYSYKEILIDAIKNSKIKGSAIKIEDIFKEPEIFERLLKEKAFDNEVLSYIALENIEDKIDQIKKLKQQELDTSIIFYNTAKSGVLLYDYVDEFNLDINKLIEFGIATKFPSQKKSIIISLAQNINTLKTKIDKPALLKQLTLASSFLSFVENQSRKYLTQTDIKMYIQKSLNAVNPLTLDHKFDEATVNILKSGQERKMKDLKSLNQILSTKNQFLELKN